MKKKDDDWIDITDIGGPYADSGFEEKTTTRRETMTHEQYRIFIRILDMIEDMLSIIEKQVDEVEPEENDKPQPKRFTV